MLRTIRTGLKEDIVVSKDTIAIIENPLYAVINEPNSTMQRLIRKLNLLDVVDEQSSSGKLDLIIQLPYVIKTEARRQQAEKRRVEIERQLAGSKYGIAYTDGTERITQLNRYNTIIDKEETSEKFKVILNTLTNLYEASKPEIFEKNWSNDKFLPLVYLHGLFYHTIDDEKVACARLRMNQILDGSIIANQDFVSYIREETAQYMIKGTMLTHQGYRSCH